MVPSIESKCCNFSIEKIAKNIDSLIFSKHKKSYIAKKMGVKPQTLHNIVESLYHGKNVGIDTINRIAIAGDVTCEELLAQEEINIEVKEES